MSSFNQFVLLAALVHLLSEAALPTPCSIHFHHRFQSPITQVPSCAWWGPALLTDARVALANSWSLCIQEQCWEHDGIPGWKKKVLCVGRLMHHFSRECREKERRPFLRAP